MNRLFGVLIFIICSGLAAVSCSNDKSTSSETVVFHPIEKNIPYFDREHIEVDKNQSYTEGAVQSEIVDNLYRYLQYPEQSEKKELDLIAGEAFYVDILFNEANQLAILDRSNNTFYQYDILADRVDSIAGEGDGPGDLNYAQEMIRDGEHIYIAMEDRRVSRFDCRPEICEYEKTIPLTGSALSIAKTGENLAILGHKAFSQDDDYDVNSAISLVNQQGEILETFGSYYNSDQWIVYLTMRWGLVRYNSLLKIYLFALEYLPLIYIFNEDFDLSETFYFTDYDQGIIKNNRKENSAGLQRGNFTIIKDITILNEDIALIYMMTFSENRFEETPEEPPFAQDYYAINLSTRESYYLGEISGEYMGKIYPSEHGLIVYDGVSLLLVE